MAQAQAIKIVKEFNDILSNAMDEYRPLSVAERLKVDGILDSMFRIDRDKYFALYSAYSSLIGDATALEDCSKHFFSRGEFQLDNNSYRCLLSMSNAAMYEQIYNILKDVDVFPQQFFELYRIAFNSAVTLLDVHKAKEILSKVPNDFFDAQDREWFDIMFNNVSLFNEHYGDEEIKKVQNYVVEILKTHRQKIIKPIYEEAGTCILMPKFFSDEGKGFLNIVVEYVSDNVDKSIDLEDDFYQVLFKKDHFPRTALDVVVYSLIPISVDSAATMFEKIVDVEF